MLYLGGVILWQHALVKKRKNVACTKSGVPGDMMGNVQADLSDIIGQATKFAVA